MDSSEEKESMPRSATGTLSDRLLLKSTEEKPEGCAGFTLLEVMVVLLIIGIIIGFATLSIDTRKDDVAREAERFAALVNLCREEAVLKGREYAVEIHPAGYTFLKTEQGKWEEMEGDDIFRPRSLLEGITLKLYIEGESVVFKESYSGEEDEIPPRLFFLSSGEMTQFEAVFQDRYSDISFSVTGDFLNDVRFSEKMPAAK